MSDFRIKHDELFLEELKIIANNKPWCYTTRERIIEQISRISFNKDNIKKILKILSAIKYRDVNNVQKSLLEDILDMDIIFNHDRMTLERRIYFLFNLEFIDFLLKELKEQNNE